MAKIVSRKINPNTAKASATTHTNPVKIASKTTTQSKPRGELVESTNKGAERIKIKGTQAKASVKGLKKPNPGDLDTVETLQQKVTRISRENNKLSREIEAFSIEKDRLTGRIKDQERHIIVLNESLIANQNYSAAAIVATTHASPTKIEADFIGDIAWVARRILTVGPVQSAHDFRAYIVIKASHTFDADFYNQQLEPNTLSAAALLRHYVGIGWKKELDPTAAFSVSKYLAHYEDVRATGVEPYAHYLKHGMREYRVAIGSNTTITHFTGDSLVRIYEDKASPVTPVIPQNASPEERHNFDWLTKHNPKTDRSKLGLYDLRPDDDVPIEGAKGEAFMKRFGLLSETPNFAGAVKFLNEMKSTNRVVTQGGTSINASIIIPIYGQLAYTLNCLHSILMHKSRYNFEIIVGDDVSPDSSGDWLPQIQSITYLRHKTNGGFINNCNLSAELAQGDTIIMLNNDTRVVDGWLDWMLDSFKIFPKAGLIGSKLFYPDGSLQEAGGIIWQDGSGWNYGRNDDPNRPRYCYARKVDFISGCSIAVPTKLWQQMKGFDPHYRPAYCEDADLCFRLREAGYETWFQPSSRIIHYEGKTSGTDITQGTKAYQITNTVKLYERWKHVLAAHRKNGFEPWLERERNISKRVLVIDACNPTPRQDAGSVSIVNLFRYYQALDYQVSFVPEDNFLYQEEEVRAIQSTGVQYLYAPFEIPMTTILQRYGHLYDIIHVIRAEIANKNLELINTLAPNAQKIYQNSDLHYLRMQRQAAVENSPELLKAAEIMKTKELHISRNFDLTISHSNVEVDILKHEIPDANIMVMPLIEKVIDSYAPFDERTDFMFLGGYGHPPNVDAALWILDEIWPRLSKALPNARLLIVGAKPPKSILSRASERVIVTGLVEDLAPWFDTTKVFLAALRYGAGAKGKVLSSLAHGVPVIATDIASEGLPLKNGKDVFMANSVEEIVTQALKLYKADKNIWTKTSSDAKTYISKNHSFEANVDLLKVAIGMRKANT